MDLNLLRGANRLRLPQFKNSKGEMAHNQPDGSDWSPNMWLVAMMGEVGEFAEELEGQDAKEVGNEAADILTYLDILCQRCMDNEVQGHDLDDTHEGTLTTLIITLGKMCEAHKKFVRGDIDKWQYQGKIMESSVKLARTALSFDESLESRQYVGQSNDGIDLADATREKFNIVSKRVGSDVFLTRSSVTRCDPKEWKE